MNPLNYTGLQHQLTFEITPTERNFKHFGFYVKLEGWTEKTTLNHAITLSMGMYHQNFEQAVHSGDDYDATNIIPSYDLRIIDQNFSHCHNPSLEAWSWLHNKPLQPFVVQNPLLYHTYLFKISNNEYWFFLGMNGPVSDLDHLTEHRFYHLLNQNLNSPGLPENELQILCSWEKGLLKNFGTSTINLPIKKTIIEIFQEQVILQPNEPAVFASDAVLTYNELNTQANQLAHYLKTAGIDAQSLVPVCMTRSSKMMVAILGILKAGGAYVPIDPAYPEHRVQYILSDTAARVVVTDEATFPQKFSNPGLLVIDLDKDWPAICNEPAENLFALPQLRWLAYVIYTSGTTGRPKGVMIEHHALIDHCYGVIKSAGLKNCKSFALFSPLVFDAGHSIIHSALSLGASIHVLSAELVTDGGNTYQYFKNHSIDCLKIVPSLWLSFALDNQIIVAQKVMIFGGESFSTLILSKLRSCHYQGAIFNHYGPTETTIGKSIYKVNINEEYQVVPIGKPFSNTRFYVVDNQDHLVPIGMPGELCIAGEGLARGYLNQPEITNSFFVVDPFCNTKGNKMYKTGDAVKWLGNGNLEYLGRKDEQVKIRGHRIEINEIEIVLNECPLVTRGVIVARKHKDVDNRLEACIITSNYSNLNSIKYYMQNRLPDYMVPVTWHLTESFPLTVNGKIDKKNLERNLAEVTLLPTYKAPANKIEIQLAEIWKILFKAGNIGTTANFIDLGGHSLLAMRMASAIRRELQTEISIASIFKYPTIALLATHLQHIGQAKTFPPLIKQPVPKHIPLSFNQGSLWFIHQATGSLPYHLPFSFNLTGSIDTNALNETFRLIICRHEPLRTVIREEDGQGYQLVLPTGNWSLQLVNGTTFGRDGNNRENFIKNFIAKQFDVTQDFSIKAVLITYNQEQHELIYVLHHIAFDGWSSYLFQKELVKGYVSILKGQTPALDELPIQYSDFAIWQQNLARTGIWIDQLAYWKNKLSGTINLQLPTDYTRPAVQSTAGDCISVMLPPGVYNRLKALSTQNGATLFMTLASALHVLLHHYTQQSDITIGTPTAGRNQQQTEPLIGYFVNTIILRNEASPTLSFLDLLHQVTANTLEAYEHQDVPFEKVVEVAAQERDVSRSPLFQVMIVLQNHYDVGNKLGTALLQSTTDAVDLQATSMFDATFIITETNDGLKVSLEYATALFRHSTAERMVRHYSNLLNSILENPGCKIGNLDLLSTEEKQRILFGYNPAIKPGSTNLTILDLIQEQQLIDPNKIAATFEGTTISYQQLAERSDKLAGYLNSLGVFQKFVPLLIDHSIDMLVSILAVLKSGAAYVPVDPEYPTDRINFILQDTTANVILCSQDTRKKIVYNKKITLVEVDGDWEKKLQNAPPAIVPSVNQDDIAYIIYTSGSTGQPKGTLITHKGLAASLNSRRQYYGHTGSMLLIPSVAFDSSVAVIFGTLISGGTLVLCRHHQIKEPQTIRLLLQNTQTLLCVPSYYRFLLEDGIVQKSKISRVIVAGENLDTHLVNKHFAGTSNCKLYNEYGPTEATVWCTVAQIEPGKSVTIGRPINTTRIYIVNKNLQLVPEGIAGELCIGGPQVAKGYLNLTEKSEEKFVKDPFMLNDENKIYRTGDLARWLPDGQLEYLGRLDDQVKIRGYRVEPGGIEKVLNLCKGILQSVVIAKPLSDGINGLAAYVVVDGEFDPGAYTRFLKERIPLFMVPEQWIHVQHFALTSNGKIDKKALPQVDALPLKKSNFTAPKTCLQQEIAAIWMQLLPVKLISIHDNFFSLGGHSLLAMRMVSALKKKLKVDVLINELFEYGNIAELADFIDKKIADPTRYISKFKYLVPVKEGGNKIPLYIIAGGGSTALRFKSFSKMLDVDQPVYVFQSPVSEKQLTGFPSTIEEIARTFINELLEQNPHGPYALSGHCIGGIIAFEMANQLQATKRDVHSLVLFDTVLQEMPEAASSAGFIFKMRSLFGTLISKIILKAQFEYFIVTRHPRSFLNYKLDTLKTLLTGKASPESVDPLQQDNGLNIFEKAECIYAEARMRYLLTPFHGNINLFVAKERYYFIDEYQKIKFKKLSSTHKSNDLWQKYCSKLNIIEIDGNHSDMFNKSHGNDFSSKLQHILDVNS